ncbi:MAG: hypothetical protein IKV18_05150 [Alistipes sp.]|nr:hypothetical protein [Alistipes sp.]
MRPRRSKYQLSVSGRRSLTPPILDGKAIFKNSIFAGAIGAYAGGSRIYEVLCLI